MKPLHRLILFTTSIICVPLTSFAQAEDKIKIILDADTGNEVDDLYAISRALIEPSWHITALNATHWQTSHWAIPESMENSHRLNQTIVGHLGLDIKTRRGGNARMYDWGDQAQHSAAAYEIISQAQALSDGEKLTIIALGALTNVASAIYIEPSIEEDIVLYWLGSTYDFEKDILKKNDFNCVMDVQALEILIMSDAEINVMPVSVAVDLTFDYNETCSKLKGIHPLGDLLCDRWTEHLDASRKSRIIWDLALIEAIIHPEWSKKVEITTSRDNGSRKMNYYQSIDADKMREEFFRTLTTHLKNLN